jgi:hypothetical protein
MCYNSTSSITNYAYVTLLAIIMYLYGDKYDKHISLFAVIVVQMQLAEYFMWKDQKCGITNKIATIAARVILFLQPLGILLGGYLFKTMNISNNVTLIITAIYSLAFSVNFSNYFDENSKICSLNKDGHLQWHFYKHNIDFKLKNINDIFQLIVHCTYFIVFLFSWILFKNTALGIFTSLLTLLIFLFHFIQFPKNHQWTTLWCFHISIGYTIYAIARGLDYKYGIF